MRGGWREGGEGGEGGREVAREEAMMLYRERASVEEEREREGGLMKGMSEEGTERGMDGARERGEGDCERWMD